MKAMKNHEGFQDWQELFRSIIGEVDGEFDPRLIYSYAYPTFFRDSLTQARGSNALELGLSRLEWLPDLPREVEWPNYDGKAMDFVAQINLSDLEVGFHPSLPEKGWLYFFVGDLWDQRVIPHCVLFFDGPITELVRKTPPNHYSALEHAFQDTMLIQFRPGFSLAPKFLDGISPSFFSTDPRYEVYQQIYEPLYSECQAEVTRLGGYPYAFQGSGQDRDAFLYLNGFETLIRHGYFDATPWFTNSSQKDDYYQKRQEGIVKSGDVEQMEWEISQYHKIEKELEKHTVPIEMLLGLESTMGRSWGDAGFLQFFICQEDLANRNFDHTFCDVIST